MKLWQKDYHLNEEIEKFTIGNDLETDLLLAPYDVIGSIAHAIMLNKSGLLNDLELEKVNKGLKEIYRKVTSADFRIEEGVEDIHSQVELMLTRVAGESGKKIHTGRSRNDQVLLDIRLYIRDQIFEITRNLDALSRQLIELSEKNKNVFMPGYTHFQAAMRSSFGLWFGAYAECIAEDIELFQSIFLIVNRNPLGSAAGYGSSFPIRRNITTELLGFSSLNVNSIAAQMGRGRTERMLSATLAQTADTLGRMSSEICLYCGQDFGFFTFPEELMTGSSIMPHKNNPDVFELIRGKCNQVKALPNEMLMLATNLPSGYHRDYQQMKERIMWAINTVKSCVRIMNFMLQHIVLNRELDKEKKYRYLFSVELVNEFVNDGMSFRDAYNKVSELIRSGAYKAPENVNYTHEGSIGNLQNDLIMNRLEETRRFFGTQEDQIKMKLSNLAGLKSG
ncbi:MAG TPA: argininosuccinate lyase [Cyclobacteriaceae bacterium]|nr:argininosuccinate lyase [Cyclobacteriaceae bacterium]